MDIDSNETANINPITFSSGRFKLHSDFKLFQRFVSEILNLKGKWTVPRSGCKQLKTDDITIRLYENQSVVLQGGKINEYKEFLQKIADIEPNSVDNLGEDDLELTPTQKASLKNINQYMLNADFDLTGIEMLDLGTTGVNSTTNLSENDDSINKGMQDHEENAQCDENTEQHITITKRLDVLTQQFESTETRRLLF